MNTLPRNARTPENALIAKVDIFYLCDGKSDKCRKTACALEDHESTLIRFCMHTSDRANSINYKDKAPTKEQLKAHFKCYEHQTDEGQTVASYWEKNQEAELRTRWQG